MTTTEDGGQNTLRSSSMGYSRELHDDDNDDDGGRRRRRRRRR